MPGPSLAIPTRFNSPPPSASPAKLRRLRAVAVTHRLWARTSWQTAYSEEEDDPLKVPHFGYLLGEPQPAGDDLVCFDPDELFPASAVHLTAVIGLADHYTLDGLKHVCEEDKKTVQDTKKVVNLD